MNSKIIILSIVATVIITFSGAVTATPASQETSASNKYQFIRYG